MKVNRYIYMLRCGKLAQYMAVIRDSRYAFNFWDIIHPVGHHCPKLILKIHFLMAKVMRYIDAAPLLEVCLVDEHL